MPSALRWEAYGSERYIRFDSDCDKIAPSAAAIDAPRPYNMSSNPHAALSRLTNTSRAEYPHLCIRPPSSPGHSPSASHGFNHTKNATKAHRYSTPSSPPTHPPPAHPTSHSHSRPEYYHQSTAGRRTACCTLRRRMRVGIGPWLRTTGRGRLFD